MKLSEQTERWSQEHYQPEWHEITDTIQECAKQILGESNGGKFVEQETWWWTEEVQTTVTKKKEAFKALQTMKTTESLEEYSTWESKKAVAEAKIDAYEGLYEKLDSRQGIKMIYKLAKTRHRRSLDMTDGIYILDKNKVILTNSDDINNRWQQYFNHLLNVENTRETLDEQPPILGAC